MFQPDAVDEPDTPDATFIVAALTATEREVVHVVVVSAIGRPTVILPARACPPRLSGTNSSGASGGGSSSHLRAGD